MPSLQDVTIPYSRLAADGHFCVSDTDDALDEGVLIALLSRSLRQAALQSSSQQPLELVSIAFDMTGTKVKGEIQFSNRIDRQTRTLIFISGEVTHNSMTALRATAIFRRLPEPNS